MIFPGALKANIDSNKGFALYPYFEAFYETFQKSSRQTLIDFFSKHEHIEQWAVFTDYAFYDKNKHSDVVVYSFIPAPTNFSRTSERLDILSFKDIKHLKKVNQSFIKEISENPILNIAIVFERERKLSFGDERLALAATFDAFRRMVEIWISESLPGERDYSSLLDDIQIIERCLLGKGGNLKLLRDIYMIATITAYLVFEAKNTGKVKKIGWFSDRDTFLSYKKKDLSFPLLLSLIEAMHHVFVVSHDAKRKSDPFIFGIPESNGAVWYDSFLRIPDLICATLADHDKKKNKFSHPKFIPIMEELISSNDKFITLGIRYLKKEPRFEAVRYTYERELDRPLEEQS